MWATSKHRPEKRSFCLETRLLPSLQTDRSPQTSVVFSTSVMRQSCSVSVVSTAFPKQKPSQPVKSPGQLLLFGKTQRITTTPQQASGDTHGTHPVSLCCSMRKLHFEIKVAVWGRHILAREEEHRNNCNALHYSSEPWQGEGKNQNILTSETSSGKIPNCQKSVTENEMKENEVGI